MDMAPTSTHTQRPRQTTTVIAVNRANWLEERFNLMRARAEALEVSNCSVAEDEDGIAAQQEVDALLDLEHVETAVDRRVLVVRLTAGEHVQEDLVITRRTTGAAFHAMYTVALPGSSTLEKRVEHTDWLWELVELACDRY
jgi:hypothetical protein